MSTHLTAQHSPVAIALHGGASNITSLNLSKEQEAGYIHMMDSAIQAGYLILKAGGTSEDAVVKVVSMLEDSPLFNAGRGSVLNADSSIEMDAAIMRGKDLKCGAVTGVKSTKNPIQLAQIIMHKSPYIFLAGDGADQFARENNLPQETPAYFITPFRSEQWMKATRNDTMQLDNEKSGSVLPLNELNVDKFGTVGAVAIDCFGNLAAATSTGGLVNKKYNRIGDSPIIGAGTYANNKTCAISCTGKGETFIRLNVAHEISSLMKYGKSGLRNAVARVIQIQLVKAHGRGGCIAIDHNGNIVNSFTTTGMFRASINNRGVKRIKIYKH